MPTIRGLLSDLNNTMNVAYPPLAALNAARKVMPNITMSGLLGGTVDSAKKAYTAPVRAMRGEFDADSPRAYEEALNLAGMVGSSSLPRLTQPVQPGVASMGISNTKENEIYKTLKALAAGDRSKTMVRGAIDLTPEQSYELSNALRNRDVSNPPFNKRNLDLSIGHTYDSRMSGEIKPSGKLADKFSIDDAMDWIRTAGDDSAEVWRKGNKMPTLNNFHYDINRGLMYPVEIPINQSSNGSVYGLSVIPKGIRK